MVDQLIQGEGDVAAWLKKSSRIIASVEKLPGDASTRKYYRIFMKSGETLILMRMETFSAVGNGLDFLVVQRHLQEAKVDVPNIIDVDATQGYILLEDLGDTTLLRRLQDVSSSDVERHLYERVIDELVEMHVFASPGRGKDIPAFKLFFDYDKLMWEMNFTLAHFYDTYLQRSITTSDRRVLCDQLGQICTLLADEPRVFTHRDFHSRNIMVTGSEPKERLVMIDFQDARLGPCQYDLASLLKDSYYQLEETQIDRLLDYYMIKWEATSGQKMDRAHFRRIFDLMSVQRNFKAIGSFASFLNRRGNATYLKYIGNTFENIRRTLLRYPEFETLRQTLFHYYYF